MEKPVTIRPNFKAELNKAENNIEVVPVNTKLYTSWIDGKTVFRNESIDNLILKLERLYNVSIIIIIKTYQINFLMQQFLLKMRLLKMACVFERGI